MNHEAMPFSVAPAVEPRSTTGALTLFVACVQLMLDAATPEDVRRRAEARALAQLPVVRALGVFDLFDVRDPALAALLRDELAQLDQNDQLAVQRARRASRRALGVLRT